VSSPNVIASSKYGPIIINVNDRYIGRSILQTGCWAEPDLELMRQLIEFRIKLSGPAMVYDVGANIGTHTLALAKLFQQTVTIRAFEAQSAVFHMLCGTTALNNLRNVHCHHAAVSDVDGAAIAFSPPDYAADNNFGGLELVEAPQSDNKDMVRAGSETVRTVTIDSFGERVDFIKLDIEGMEHIALRGCGETLRRHRPFLFLELLKTDVTACLRTLAAHSYRVYQHGMDAIALPSECDIAIGGMPEMSAPET
jgi:FkbM family methyltransferase